MANDHGAGHPAMDYAEHERTYKLFTGMAKWGTILMVAHPHLHGGHASLT